MRLTEMFEHMSDLPRSHAGKREGRELVLTEELRARGFVAVAWRAAPELSDKKQLIGVEGMDGVALHVAVEQGRELGDLDFVAGFFADFASGGDRRRFAHISPAPGERPVAVGEFADEEDAVVTESRDADIDFRGGVTGFLSKKIKDGSSIG